MSVPDREADENSLFSEEITGLPPHPCCHESPNLVQTLYWCLRLSIIKSQDLMQPMYQALIGDEISSPCIPISDLSNPAVDASRPLVLCEAAYPDHHPNSCPSV